ncbi:pilus assembly protein PilM [Patescibacteria group bacterium]|nr:pilus assembly protein PilM [Patescibacteria group bacterium]MBU1895746.1 pilus assembly protein PilM [Patescibacteria group bacterium]
MSLFGDNKESYLGVDIGAGGIKLVELRKTKGRPQLWTYGIAEGDLDIHIQSGEVDSSPKDEIKVSAKEDESRKASIRVDDPRVDRFASVLKKLVETSKVSTKIAAASLPVSYVFHSLLTLPEVEKKQIDLIVKAEIAKILQRPVDEMQIVHQEIPQTKEEKKKKYQRLLVTAVPKDLVRFYTSVFQKAGLQLEALETEAFAIERSLVGHDPATVMVIDIGSERTNFFIMDGGLPMTHRSVQIGGNKIDKVLQNIMGVDAVVAKQIKYDLSALDSALLKRDEFDNIINPIIKEIEYGFDLFLRQSGNEGKRPEKVILTGGSGQFLPILERIQESFNFKVFVGDPWARVVYQQGLKPVLDEIGPRMPVCIGLAMRNMV